MKRRPFLSGISLTLSGSVAGCNSIRKSRSSPPFAFDVSMIKPYPTDQRPPILQIKVTNIHDVAHSLTISDNAFPFATSEATKSGSSLVLDPDIPTDRKNKCWRGIQKSLPEISGQKFEPNESVSAEYAVLNGDTAGDCWPKKTFKFQEQYFVDTDNINSIDGGTEYNWEFLLQVTSDKSISIKSQKTVTSQ